MDKKIFKILVFFLVGLFVVSMVALPFLQGLGDRQGTSERTPEEIYQFYGKTEVTVSGYSSSISITGNLSKLREIKAEFLENDWIDSETSISADRTIYNLKSSEYTKEASDILIANGFEVITDVNLKFPSLVEEINTEETYAILKTSPRYRIGDKIMIEFIGFVQNNELIHLAGFDVVPYAAEVILNAEITDIRRTQFELILEDEEKQAVIQERYNVSFEDSKVLFEVSNPEEGIQFFDLELEKYELKIHQSLDVFIHPSEKQGVLEGMDFVISVSDLYEKGEEIELELTIVLDKGVIRNVVDYRILE